VSSDRQIDRSEKIIHIAPTVTAHHDQVHVASMLGQILDGAAANGHRAPVKIGISSPPATQAAIKACPYLAIDLGCGANVIDVGKPGTPGRDHPQGAPRNGASSTPTCNTLLSTDSSTSTTTRPGLKDVAPPCRRIIATGLWARATRVAAVEPTRPR
jgi:hypothetical protein